MFSWLTPKTKSPIAGLYSHFKGEWCKLYFPEYAELFDGYPPAVPVKFCNPGETSRFSGQTRPVELTPWEYFDGLDGSIDVYGYQWAIQADGKASKTLASESDYIEWCDARNWYRSGEGLDPALFIGAADYRGSQWRADTEKYQSNLRDPKTKWLTKPDRITCTTGIYFPDRGPTSLNPFGVNASFHPNGSKEPSYVSRRFGPDCRPSVTQLPGATPVVWWDDSKPRSTQADYDRARYLVWL